MHCLVESRDVCDHPYMCCDIDMGIAYGQRKKTVPYRPGRPLVSADHFAKSLSTLCV